MKRNMNIGKICMAGMLAWVATASAEMLEDFEPGTSYSGAGTVQADPDNAGNQVLALVPGEVATFIPSTFVGTVTMNIYDFGELAQVGGLLLDAPRWGVADANESVAVAIMEKTFLDAAAGYAMGTETSKTGAWFSPSFFGGPRQVIALDDPLTTGVFEGVGKWTTWTFDVAAGGGVTISSAAGIQSFGTVDAMDTIWVSGGRSGRSTNGVLIDDITVVPEPATTGLLVFGTFALLLKRRFRL